MSPKLRYGDICAFMNVSDIAITAKLTSRGSVTQANGYKLTVIIHRLKLTIEKSGVRVSCLNFILEIETSKSKTEKVTHL